MTKALIDATIIYTAASGSYTLKLESEQIDKAEKLVSLLTCKAINPNQAMFILNTSTKRYYNMINVEKVADKLRTSNLIDYTFKTV